jgi:radical SAM superfamily enzyme with C-terminal helix-hairpin-helix motif
MNEHTVQAYREIAEAGEMLRRVMWRAMSSNEALTLPQSTLNLLREAREAIHAAHRQIDCEIDHEIITRSKVG